MNCFMAPEAPILSKKCYQINFSNTGDFAGEESINKQY